MNEIIIELGILDKIKSAINGVKNYNPFRDATGRFSNANESKKTNESLLAAIKYNAQSIKNGIDTVFNRNDYMNITKNIGNLVSDISNNISGIDSKTPVKIFTANKDWSNEVGIDDMFAKIFGKSASINVLAIAKKKGVVISPFMTKLFSDKEIDSSDIPEGFRHFINSNDLNDSEYRSKFVQKAMAHELLHTRERDNGFKLSDYMNDKGEINTDIYNMSEEEGHTELLSQIFSFKKSDKSINDFINNKDGYYPEEVAKVLARARDSFSDSPKEAIKYISDSHKKGFDVLKNPMRNINFSMSNHKEDRKWLIESLSKLDIDI